MPHGRTLPPRYARGMASVKKPAKRRPAAAAQQLTKKDLKAACEAMKKGVFRGKLDLVKATLAKGLDVNHPLDRHESTALLLAVLARETSLPVVKALLAAGASVTKKNKYGQNARETAKIGVYWSSGMPIR